MIRFRSLLLPLALCGALLATPGSTWASGKPLASKRSPSGEYAQRTVRYWTPARMRSARPATVAPAPHRYAAISATLHPGKPHIWPPAPPARRGVTAAVSSTPVGSAARYPYRTHGKVFFTLGPDRYVCSATAVNSPNKSTVMTAGHCVNSGGRWASRWVFVPGYRNGRRPYGTFVARRLWASEPWLSRASFNYDFGAAVLAKNSRNQRLIRVIGGRGIATGRHPEQLFEAFGYPADPPFDGEILRDCPGSFDGLDPESSLDGGPPTLGISCDMTGGASGGGWVIGGSLLNGVNSYGYSELPGVWFGPYFGAAVWDLYRLAGQS